MKKEILNKNILDKEDDRIYRLSLKRVIISLIVLVIIFFVITFINGAMVHKTI